MIISIHTKLQYYDRYRLPYKLSVNAAGYAASPVFASVDNFEASVCYTISQFAVIGLPCCSNQTIGDECQVNLLNQLSRHILIYV